MLCKCNIQFKDCKYKLQSVNCIVAKVVTEEKVSYPIITLSQLPLILKGFRKECGLTQAAMAEKLGITQQSYAYFEANPVTATFDRLFMVLRLLGVEISLNQTISVASTSLIPADTGKGATADKASKQKIRKAVGATTTK